MKITLILTPKECLAYQKTQDSWVFMAHFAQSELGQNAFAAWLLKTPKAQISLLLNLPDEVYQAENIPQLRGNNRRQFITRRASSPFMHAEVSAVISQGIEKDLQNASDHKIHATEKILFAAQNNSPLFSPWLLLLEKATIDAIYSFALSSHFLIKDLQENAAAKSPEKICVLASLHDGFLRQSGFLDGNLCFSRMIEVCNAEQFLYELQQLTHYLSSQNLLRADQKIPLYFLENTANFDLPSLENTPFLLKNLAISALNNKASPANDFNALFLNRLFNAPKKQLTPLLNASLRASRAAKNAKKNAAFFMLLIFLVGAFIAFFNDVERNEIADEMKQIKSQKERALQVLDAEKQNLIALPENAQQQILLYQNALENPTSPQIMLSLLSAQLTKNAAIFIERFAWESTDKNVDNLQIEGRISAPENIKLRELKAIFNRLQSDLESVFAVEITQNPFQFPIENGALNNANNTKNAAISSQNNEEMRFIIQLKPKRAP